MSESSKVRGRRDIQSCMSLSLSLLPLPLVQVKSLLVDTNFPPRFLDTSRALPWQEGYKRNTH